jgi:hypothetical protein
MGASVERTDCSLFVKNVVALVATQLSEPMLSLLFGLGVLLLAAHDMHVDFALVVLENLALAYTQT